MVEMDSLHDLELSWVEMQWIVVEDPEDGNPPASKLAAKLYETLPAIRTVGLFSAPKHGSWNVS